MPPVWRKHLIICLCLGLLAIPIYFVDLESAGGGGGNWIALDFTGIIFWTYITLLAIHIVLSSIGVVSFPKSGALRIHFWSMVLSVILLVTGFVVYGKLLRSQAITSRSQLQLLLCQRFAASPGWAGLGASCSCAPNQFEPLRQNALRLGNRQCLSLLHDLRRYPRWKRLSFRLVCSAGSVLVPYFCELFLAES